jgi:hypothetical protein
MQADGSHARRVSHGGFDVEPVPDGSRIAFARLGAVTPGGLQLAAVYVVNVDGSHLHRVVAARAGLEHPDWSPDSRWILRFLEGPDEALRASRMGFGKAPSIHWRPFSCPTSASDASHS